MKKFTLSLFAVFFTINACFAQQVIPWQKKMTNNQNAQEMIAGLKMVNPLNSLNLPLICFNKQNPLLKSGSSTKLDSVILSKRSSISAPWIKYNKLVFEYDGESRLSKITTTAGLDDWEDYPETAIFNYNSTGLLESIKVVGIYYNQTPDSTSIKFTYDDMGRMQKAYNYFSNGELYMGKTFSYNIYGKISEIFVEENWWSYWTALHQYSYDSEGKLLQYKEEKMYSILATYEWNSDGNLIQEDFKDWYEIRKNIYEYNGDGNRIKSEQYYWMQPTMESDYILQDHSIEKYEYLDISSKELVQLNLSVLSLDNVFDEVEYIPNKLISKSFTDSKMSEYFYSSFSDNTSILSSTSDKIASEFAVFPNPAIDKITLTWKAGNGQLNLKIYQLTGACIMDKVISSQEIVNLEKLSKGVYVYKLSDKKEILKSGKLVIE